jgi:(E)-4-hydroxy-3-methylbut-2-enyl-diphosphate synthase
MRVAVMGCVVNGPGEAREADLGVAAGNGKGEIIRKGERIATVREEDIVETIVHFAREMADEIRAERGSGPAEVLT